MSFLFAILFVTNFMVSNGKFYINDDLTKAPCATFYSAPKHHGISFSLRDQDMVSDLADDDRVFEGEWSETHSISVERGCKMKVCMKEYLDGDCYTLEEGSHSVNENGFIAGLYSAKCTCEKECKCEDIHIKRSIYGRAYVDGSCQICNSLYTEITEGRRFRPVHNVTAFRLRKGCKITIYSEEGLTGERTVFDTEIVKDLKGEIGSYHFECNDALYEPPARSSRPNSYPELVNITETKSDLDNLLANPRYKHHVGLNAALISHIKGRCFKNVYVLVLGTTESGKSSVINVLLRQQAMTIRDGRNGIFEVSIPVTVDSLGVTNSRLHIIESLPIEGRKGIASTASNLATLDHYLSNHDELRDKTPNVVLIVHRFDDNRFFFNGSLFERMLRLVGQFSKRITNDKYSNVVFVLTHFCSETKPATRRPKNKIKEFKKTIENLNVFPRPIHIVVAENNLQDNELLMSNNNAALPNNEFYPENLIQKMEMVTKKAGDILGNGVVSVAFRNVEDPIVSPITFLPSLPYSSTLKKFVSPLSPENLKDGEDKELTARVANLEALLVSERSAFQRFKNSVATGELACSRGYPEEDLEKAKQEIWNKIKVDLDKLFA